MPKYSILGNYQHMPAPQRATFGLSVGTAMTGNVNFTTPPSNATPVMVTNAANALIAAAAIADNGNEEDTANKSALQDVLTNLLDLTADYVELNAGNDPVKIASAGFTLASTNRAQAPVGITGITSITNLASTKLGLQLLVAINAWCYVIQISTVPGVWTTVLIVTDPHNAVLTGLIPGTSYAIRVCAMGSGNQESEWSDVMNHMST
jgi:hypothetical protein